MKLHETLLSRGWWEFLWRYLRGRTPWDTGITPPEVVAFLKDTTPGSALDLGCGTGTNAIAMTRRGWQVVAIDFMPGAILSARQKAAREKVAVDFRVGDVTRLDRVGGTFDYILDIGCLHSLPEDRQKSYARGLKPLLRPNGTYMLYAWLPRNFQGKKRGIAPETLTALFTPPLTLDRQVLGEESGAPSAWYWFKKRP